MGGLGCLFVLLLGVQVILCQGPPGPPGPYGGGPPHKCHGPPQGVKDPQSCCQAKPMFTEEELAECGFEKFNEGNRQGPPSPPDCSKQECLLKKRDLLNADNTIKYDAMRAYMTSWVETNPEFQTAVDAATNVCIGENGPPGPKHVCEANRLMFCVGAVIFTNCPTWQETDDCKRLKDHMEECRGPNFPPPN